MTLLALSPAPTAASPAAGQANCSASATGFGAVMTDAKAALAVADASADATADLAVPSGAAATVSPAGPVGSAVLTAAVLQGPAASVPPAGTPGSAVTGTAKDAADPASLSATGQPVPDALSAVALAVALPALVPTLVPNVAHSFSPQPAAGPLTDASTAAPPTSAAASLATAAGPPSATSTAAATSTPALRPTAAVSAEAAASLARPTSPRANASTDTPAAPSAAPNPASMVPLPAPPASSAPTSSAATTAPALLPAAATPAAATSAASVLPAARTKAAPVQVTDAEALPPITTPQIRLEAVAAPVAVSAAAPTQNTAFASQLARPIFTLATAAPGSHTMTISVTPDALGPVTVRAHVSPDGIRVELFAPTELGRDAIRAILPELRKDLAGAGVGANLDLSSQNQPSDAGDRRGDAAPRPERAYVVPAGIVGDEDVTAAPTRILTTSSIDVLA